MEKTKLKYYSYTCWGVLKNENVVHKWGLVETQLLRTVNSTIEMESILEVKTYPKNPASLLSRKALGFKFDEVIFKVLPITTLQPFNLETQSTSLKKSKPCTNMLSDQKTGGTFELCFVLLK